MGEGTLVNANEKPDNDAENKPKKIKTAAQLARKKRDKKKTRAKKKEEKKLSAKTGSENKTQQKNAEGTLVNANEKPDNDAENKPTKIKTAAQLERKKRYQKR